MQIELLWAIIIVEVAIKFYWQSLLANFIQLILAVIYGNKNSPVSYPRSDQYYTVRKRAYAVHKYLCDQAYVDIWN